MPVLNFKYSLWVVFSNIYHQTVHIIRYLIMLSCPVAITKNF